MAASRQQMVFAGLAIIAVTKKGKPMEMETRKKRRPDADSARVEVNCAFCIMQPYARGGNSVRHTTSAVTEPSFGCLYHTAIRKFK
jgi:hypothetical protein